jgi:hypothetical protein
MPRSPIAGFGFDDFTLDLWTLNRKQVLDGGSPRVVHRLDDSVIPSDERYLVTDPFTPLALKQPGTAWITDEVQPYEAWLDTEIYRKHCLPYGIHHVPAVAFRVPNWKHRYLVFHFMNDYGRRFFLSPRNMGKLEQACIPFRLCRLVQHGQMCSETLLERLS